MNGSEWEGKRQEDIELEQPIALSLSRRQIDVLLVAIHDELVDSRRSLEQIRTDMANDSKYVDDYNIVVRYVHDLEDLQKLLVTPPTK